MGDEPVREWLKAMTAEDRRRIGEDPHEIRTDLAGKRTARLRKTPAEELALARANKGKHERRISTLDSLLEEDGILAEVEAVAVKRVIAWQLHEGRSNHKDGDGRTPGHQYRAGARLVEKLGPDGPARHWARLDARAVPVAGGHAPVPGDGERVVEVRTVLPSQRIARVLFHLHDRKLVVVHAMIKKTRKTPAADLNLARKRMKDVTR